jgi:cytochrome c-type biogenesis protein CcmF
MLSRRGVNISLPDTVMSESLILRLQKVLPDGSVEIGVKESDAILQWVTLKAYKFPWILVLWLGIIITAVGILISMVSRILQNNRQKLRAVS